MKSTDGLLVLFAFIFLPLRAASLSDLTYKTISEKITIIDCNQAAAGELVIPNIIQGKLVISIGANAFRSCTKLTSITIPDSVTSIGDHAFGECTNLTSFTIPDGVTNIAQYVFSACNNLKTINIPDGVTNIGEGALISCSSLTSITIPDSVTSIENYAFEFCRGLTSITIPDGVTSMGDRAFSKCSSLKSITLLGAAPTVGADAFKEVASIAFVTTKALSSYGKVGESWNGLTLKISSESIATDPKKATAAHSDEKELILLSSHLNAVELGYPALLKKRETWKSLRIEAQSKIDAAYRARLKKLKTSMVQNGDIAAARAINNAIKGGIRNEEEPAVLTNSRKIKYDALLAKLKPIDRKYWKDLIQLKNEAQTKGNLEQVEIVLLEITRVLAPYK